MNGYEINEGLADLDSLLGESTLPSTERKYLEEQCIEKDKIISKLKETIKQLETAMENDIKTRINEFCTKEREKIQLEIEFEVYKKNGGQPFMINSILEKYNKLRSILEVSGIDIETILGMPYARLRLIDTNDRQNRANNNDVNNVCNSCNSDKQKKNKGNTKEKYSTCKMVELRNQGYSVKEIARIIGCSERLVYIRCDKEYIEKNGVWVYRG